jgi:hypothetical protein
MAVGCRRDTDYWPSEVHVRRRAVQRGIPKGRDRTIRTSKPEAISVWHRRYADDWPGQSLSSEGFGSCIPKGK